MKASRLDFLYLAILSTVPLRESGEQEPTLINIEPQHPRDSLSCYFRQFHPNNFTKI
jgi:hypothetical protein